MGYSKDLSHPADRRRLKYWSERVGFEINTVNPLDCDLLVLSSNTNYRKWFKGSKVPIVLDIVDGYVGASPSFLEDFGRNTLRSIRGKSSFWDLTYTNHIKRASRGSLAIVTPSQEISEELRGVNQNVLCIPDSFQEFSNCDTKNSRAKINNPPVVNILWEGFGSNLKHFLKYARQFRQLFQTHDAHIHFVTQRSFREYGGVLKKIDTEELLTKYFRTHRERLHFYDWSIDKLQEVSEKCDFAIIPIDLSDSFAALKSENKLLSMWTLGLPVFVSPTNSYVRAMKKYEIDNRFMVSEDWSQVVTLFQGMMNLTGTKLPLGGRKQIKANLDLAVSEAWGSLIPPDHLR